MCTCGDMGRYMYIYIMRVIIGNRSLCASIHAHTWMGLWTCVHGEIYLNVQGHMSPYVCVCVCVCITMGIYGASLMAQTIKNLPV